MIKCFQLVKNNTKVIFIFNSSYYSSISNFDINDIQDVYVTGSFCQWQIEPKYKLKPVAFNVLNRLSIHDKKNSSTEKIFWTLTKKYSSLYKSGIGNTGFIEFKFVAIKKDGTKIYFDAPSENLQERFDNNNVITLTDQDRQEIEEANKKFSVKKLWDFDNNQFNDLNSIDAHHISNVRKVPGTRNLWRGYHPYKKSRMEMDTEETRTQIVNRYIEQNKVQSLITLSGDEKLCDGEYMTPYVQSIIGNKNQCIIDTSYETVYYKPLCKEYNTNVNKILNFIAGHPQPFYIHCRLGSDRTGTMSAVLAAICGASWNEIAADYEQTSFMGIGEYRNRKMLQQYFERLLGKKIEDVKDLSTEVCRHFIKVHVADAKLLLEVKEKLGADRKYL